MRFFRFGKKTLTDDELREHLFDLVAHQKHTQLAHMLQTHDTRIRALMLIWKTLPTPVRSDPITMQRWAEGVIGIAAAYEALGDSSLIQHLVGEPAENPLLQWEERLANAQAAFDTGKYADTISIVHDGLIAFDQRTGPGVAHARARGYGLLGAAYFRLGDRANAIGYTTKAKEVCVQSDDQEGVAIYTRNLQVIDRR